VHAVVLAEHENVTSICKKSLDWHNNIDTFTWMIQIPRGQILIKKEARMVFVMH